MRNITGVQGMPSVAPVGVRRDVCDGMQGMRASGIVPLQDAAEAVPVFVTSGFRFGSVLASTRHRAEPRDFPHNGRREPPRHQGL